MSLKYRTTLLTQFPIFVGRSPSNILPLKSTYQPFAVFTLSRVFSDPLLNCLRLQQVIRGIKCYKGSPAAHRLPITDSILLVFHQVLDLSSYDHSMFWACSLGYFGFLCSTEFTVSNLAGFLPDIQLSVVNILTVNSMLSPSCLRISIIASKTEERTLFAQFRPCCLNCCFREMSLALCFC